MEKQSKKITEIEIFQFEEYLRNGKRLESTINKYMIVLRSFALSCEDKTDLEYYNEYILEHCIKKRSYHARHVLREYINFAKMENGVKRFLKKNLLPVREKQPEVRRLLTEKQKTLVMNQLQDHKHKVMSMIQSVTGVRTGTVLRLKRGNVSWEETNGKMALRLDFMGKGERSFAMWVYDPNTCRIIDDYISMNLVDKEYYFLIRTTDKNKSDINLALMSNYKRYERDINQALEKCGFDKKEFKTHDFRRLFARKVWETTHDPVSVKEALHHRNFDTTARYLRQSGLQNKDVLEKIYIESN